MEISGIIKRIQDIMRNDAGVNGDAQRLEEISWMLFLKVYSAKEEEWEIKDDNYVSIIPDYLHWQNWATDHLDGTAMTGEELLKFVDSELFNTLKNLPINEKTPVRQSIVRDVFKDHNHYMKDGVLLRQVLNEIDKINFDEYDDKHSIGDMYENILKSLQSAGNAGEFYTPRAVTDFIVQMVDPQIGHTFSDFAIGTGGFATSTIKHLDKQVKTAEDRTFLNNQTIHGVEKKPLPYILCVTNLLLNGIDEPHVLYGNSLERNVNDYNENDKFDIIIMNPPYGGSEKNIIKQNFPVELRSSETADLFMSLIMYRLKTNGKAAVILPDGFLFGTDNAKVNIKKKLITEFNLHTIIRLPGSVFAPYTSITTNILFFDNTHPTNKTWFYRMDMPKGYKNFSKTRPMKVEHFKPVMDWWKNRVEIEDTETDTFKSKFYSKKEIQDRNYDIDLCGFPHEEEIILPPDELIPSYIKQREELNNKIDITLSEIMSILNIHDNELRDED